MSHHGPETVIRCGESRALSRSSNTQMHTRLACLLLATLLLPRVHPFSVNVTHDNRTLIEPTRHTSNSTSAATDGAWTRQRHSLNTNTIEQDLEVLGLDWATLLAHARHLPNDTTWMQLPNFKQRTMACADMAPLFANVKKDMSVWSQGISRSTTAKAIQQVYGAGSNKGIAVGFKNGKAYLVQQPKIDTSLGIHGNLILVYMKVMILLERLFGPEIPDVEFVISTVDRPTTPPTHLLGNATPAPVMRFCRTPAFSDLLIPIFHSYIAEYAGAVSKLAPNIYTDKPWDRRDNMLFGRFSRYMRHMHAADPYTPRVGVGSTPICDKGWKTRACSVRTHFCNWALSQTKTIDVSCHKRTTMARHADHKYLLHLDGQGLSSRFEQLMYLGSLIMKEESGYIGYFYHLLKPYKHFMPIWKERPEDVLDALTWAKSHNEEARKMGEAARQLALRYLGPKGKACYWLHLLKEYASRLTYTPGPPSAADTDCTDCTRYWRPVLQFAKDELVPWLAQHEFKNYTFMP